MEDLNGDIKDIYKSWVRDFAVGHEVWKEHAEDGVTWRAEERGNI